MSKKQNGLVGRVWGAIVRRKLLFAAGLIVLLLLSGGLWLVFGGASDEDATTTSNKNGEQRWSTYKDKLERGAELRKLANAALTNGDTETVGNIYDEAVTAQADSSEKVTLRLEQAKLLYGKGLHDEAITVAKDAERLSEDQYQVADWLSRVFERRKDYDQAARYYTLAAKWVDSPTNQLGFTKQYYEEEATRVQALAKGAS